MTTNKERPGIPVDAGLGVASPWDESVPSIDVSGIKEALGTLMSKGLPASTTTAGVLLDLRSVYARSIHPYDPQSRLVALNQLLVRLLAEWDGDRGEALRIMYGVAAGCRGTTLTVRRDRAHTQVGYELNHFRKDIEAQLVAELADEVYADLLRYRRRIRRAAEGEEPTGDTPTLNGGDLTHEEELISRIWQHVYGLRAELIAVARLGVDPQLSSTVADHRQAADRTSRHLRDLLAEYTSTYSKDLIRHGDAEYHVEALRRIGGGPLTG